MSTEATALPLNCVIQGDCRQVLQGFPQDSVDLVFADPPYNLQLSGDLWRPNNTLVDAVDDEWDRFESFQAYDAFTRSWLAACRRVMKTTATLWVSGSYHNIHRIGAILQDLGYWILNDVAWIKTNPMPNFRGVRLTNAHETLIWAQKVRNAPYVFNHHAMKALNGDLQMRSDWHLPICTGKERIKLSGSKAHATQKPESLLYRVILASSKPGDVILDPFFGTGTTGAVARRLGRDWIGIEQNPNYVKIARQRIAAIQPDTASLNLGSADDKRRQSRVPFGSLVERGLLRPGQTLYFGGQDDLTATVLANGHVRFMDLIGSIHEVGRAIQKAPCNGWQAWYYQDEASGQRIVIDQLRQQIRQVNGE